MAQLKLFSQTQNMRSLHLVFGCLVAFTCLLGCNDERAKQSNRIAQNLNSAKTQNNSLHDAMRFLSQMSPLNLDKVGLEAQLLLNKWMQTAPATQPDKANLGLVDGLPPDLRSAVGLDALNGKNFSQSDVEYIYQCRLMRNLAGWIIEQPLRDSLVRSWLAKTDEKLNDEELGKLEQACKLFDWSVRNIVIEGKATDVEQLADDPRRPLNDTALGYGYLPWQTALYGIADYIERGRVFSALAQQRGVESVWVALRLPSSPSAKLWAVGVLIGDKCFVFEPKLGLPIVHPDSQQLVTLQEIQTDDRILRRLDVPGRFDYAVNAGDAANLEFLIDADAGALTDRMATLQTSLTGDDRLVLVPACSDISEKLKKQFATSQISLWQMPLLARLYAEDVRGRLNMNSPFTFQYIIQHAVWFMDTPASAARFKHLNGIFENSFDTRGALATYMDCRVPEEKISRLPDDPDVQKELGIPRLTGESLEVFQTRLTSYQRVFRNSKIDASFLLGQLHFDLGNFDDVEGWLKKRTLSNSLAARYFPAARYTLARAYEEQGKTQAAIELFNEDGSPMEAGNRLRVRYLSADKVEKKQP